MISYCMMFTFDCMVQYVAVGREMGLLGSNKYYDNLWWLWRQKRVSPTGINICIPQYSVVCNYLSLSAIHIFGPKVLTYLKIWFLFPANKMEVFFQCICQVYPILCDSYLHLGYMGLKDWRRTLKTSNAVLAVRLQRRLTKMPRNSNSGPFTWDNFNTNMDK